MGLPANGDAINSVQNGVLLDAGMHMLFDQYYVSTLITDWFLVKKERWEVAAMREVDEKEKLTELSEELKKT